MMTWLATGVVAMNLLLLAYTAYSLGRSRQLAEEQAAQWTQSLSLAIEKELIGIVTVADIALRSVVDELSRQRAAGSVDDAQFDAFIEQVRQRVPFVDGIRVTDADGILIHGTEVVAARRVDLSDRAHFIELRGAHPNALAFSPLQKSRTNGKWVIVIARRVDEAGSRFAGMVFAPIAVDDLTATFARYAIPKGSTITLRGADLGVIARHPPPVPGEPVPVGHADVGKALADLIASGADEGTVRAVAPIDGVLRVRSYHRLAGTPFVLVVGRATDEYLAAWKAERVRAVVISVAFLLLSTLTSLILHSNWRRLESALAAKERMALTDFLTGLANRRAFIDAMDREISRARRYASTFSVLMIDIDHFKSVNDTHGHEVGDATLRSVAACARGVLREVDLMARWGGEEFVVLLPDTDAKSAAEAAERLRARVEATELVPGPPTIRATISIGHATLDSDGESVDALIQRADRALYRAKSLGRNRVCR